VYLFFSSFQWISSSNKTISLKNVACDSYIDYSFEKKEDPTWMTLKSDLYRSYEFF